MERYLDFWGLAKIGQKPGIWAILALAWILYMERYLDFWELGQIRENPEIGTFSPNLEFLKRDLLPLF
jgi:hypothetical protein